MASAHSTFWAEADATSPRRDRALAVSRMVLGSVIRGALGIRATLPSGTGSLEPLQYPTYHGSWVFRAGSSLGLVRTTATDGKPGTRESRSRRSESCAEDGPILAPPGAIC